MSFAKKVMSFILAAGMSVIPVLTSAAYATENLYVYDTTIQEKSKALSNDESEPFNVFDIYDAYHEILANGQQPVTTTTTTKATTTKTTLSTTKKTTVTTKATSKTTSKTTTKTTTTKLADTTTTSKSTTKVTTTAESATTTTAATTVPTTTGTQAGQFEKGKYINGIDVSQWQYKIDWQAVKNSGQVDFAIIK